MIECYKHTDKYQDKIGYVTQGWTYIKEMLSILDVYKLKHERIEYKEHFRNIISCVIGSAPILECLLKVLKAD